MTLETTNADTLMHSFVVKNLIITEIPSQMRCKKCFSIRFFAIQDTVCAFPNLNFLIFLVILFLIIHLKNVSSLIEKYFFEPRVLLC